ncbi:hypothetical protein ABVK25_000951 [Lepraria finkii]|uniref:Uncharacterized protein n=1 Tax=Lepraria finkii TaxID=1340010 RepID=A0ABR4BPJ1_9LECA
MYLLIFSHIYALISYLIYTLNLSFNFALKSTPLYTCGPPSRLLLSSSTPSGLHTLPLRHKEHIATPCEIMPCVAFPSYPAKLSQFFLGDAVRQSTRWRFLYIVYHVLDIILCKWPATGALLVHLTCYVCVFPCLIRVALDTFDFGRRSNLGASTLLLTDQLADACVPAP